MSAPPIGSILLGSGNVAEMKRWYQDAFGAVEEGGAFAFGPVLLFIEEHSDVSGPATDAARCIVNLNVEDCRALEQHLKALDVNWIRPVEEMPFGIIGTVADPDGNYLQIIQWAAPADDHKS